MGKRIISLIFIGALLCLTASWPAASWTGQGQSPQEKIKESPTAQNVPSQATASGASAAAQTGREDFLVTVGIEGIEEGLEVAAVSGLGAETAVIDFREASDPFVRKLPGPTSARILVLTLPGVTLPRGVLQWISDTHAGVGTKRVVTVSFQEPRRRTNWTLVGCFPSGLSIDSASGSSFTTLAIACDRLALSE